ncbi:MAG: hypothetical protein JXA92_01520 [candidate division Zixibacteria bacterium]|nr:hypothetical protein [candidate division Zixibacteria bacterium]
MKKNVSLVILIGLLLSCAPKKEVSEAPTDIYPYDLKIAVDKGTMTLSWKTHGDGLKSGYNIYISREPLVEKYPGRNLPSSVRPFNPVNYPGDTNPDDSVTYFTAEYLEDGVKYYVSVRVNYTDRTLSRPSNEVVAVCGARSEFNLAFRYRSENDGYSFFKDEPVRADAVDNDIYFYAKDGVDYLASPSRLDGFLRKNRFRVLSLKGVFDFVKDKVNGSNVTPDEDRVEIKKGDWVLVETVENTHALLQVLDFIGDGEEREVKLFLAFSPLKDEILF